ncbi:MAG: helix-turn-helix domain-containing protein [bacterium]
MSKTLDDRQQFVELRARGYSFSKIAEELGISKPTPISWSQEEQTNKDIQNQRTLAIDELQEKYIMTKRHRIAVFGEVLNRAKAELDGRDLSTLSTDKLITLVIKLSDTLKQDETELELLGEVELPIFQLGEVSKWKI